MNNLKPCPCGEVPSGVYFYQAESGYRETYFFALANCCESHAVKFDFEWNDSVSQKDLEEATNAAWNAAPRGNE